VLHEPRKLIEALDRLRRLPVHQVMRRDVITVVLELAAAFFELAAELREQDEYLRDLAGDLEDIDRRARPFGDGQDIDSRRRFWRGRRR
jgi:hypothetical protein